jgi:hypothetical protein
VARVMVGDRWGQGVWEGKLTIQRYTESPGPSKLIEGFPKQPSFSLVFTRRRNTREESDRLYLRSTEKGLFLMFPIGEAHKNDNAEQSGPRD